MDLETPTWFPLYRERRVVPKVVGGDYEFSNFITPLVSRDGSGRKASRALLAEIEGVPSIPPAAPSVPTACGPLDDASTPVATGGSYQDWGRKFLVNGACFYVDMDHLEGCLPEVTSATDHVAATHAIYRIAQRAARAVNRKLSTGGHLHLLATNSDGCGSSFGSHLNLLMTNTAWEDLFHRKLHYQGFLAAYQASSIVFTGLGKVGAEGGCRPVPFQLSQRADFIEMLVGPQTTHQRPILNNRREALCGQGRLGAALHPATADLARLHVIFYDHNLCHCASFLKIGVLQLITAMIEGGVVDTGLLLEDPVNAVRTWSHDPVLRARVRLLTGTQITAVDLQLRFLEAAAAFVERGGADGVVPQARAILELWAETLGHLAAGRFGPLTRRLDWVMKLSLLQQALQQDPHLDWASPEIKRLDHIYSSLDLDEGLYWACEREGLVDRLVAEDRIAQLVTEPPDDTRAWARGRVLQQVDPACVHRLDWDQLEFTVAGPGLRACLDLPDPLGFTRVSTATRLPETGELWDVLDALGAVLTHHP